MLSLPRILIYKPFIVAALFTALISSLPLYKSSGETVCHTATPFSVSFAGINITGHVCGNTGVKVPHQISFRLKADDVQQSTILKQLADNPGRFAGDVESFHY